MGALLFKKKYIYLEVLYIIVRCDVNFLKGSVQMKHLYAEL